MPVINLFSNYSFELQPEDRLHKWEMKTRFNNTEDTVAPAVLTNTKVNKAINLRKMVAVHLSLYNTFFLNNLK